MCHPGRRVTPGHERQRGSLDSQALHPAGACPYWWPTPRSTAWRVLRCPVTSEVAPLAARQPGRMRGGARLACAAPGRLRGAEGATANCAGNGAIRRDRLRDPTSRRATSSLPAGRLLRGLRARHCHPRLSAVAGGAHFHPLQHFPLDEPQRALAAAALVGRRCLVGGAPRGHRSPHRRRVTSRAARGTSRRFSARFRSSEMRMLWQWHAHECDHVHRRRRARPHRRPRRRHRARRVSHRLRDARAAHEDPRLRARPRAGRGRARRAAPPGFRGASAGGRSPPAKRSGSRSPSARCRASTPRSARASSATASCGR